MAYLNDNEVEDFIKILEDYHYTDLVMELDDGLRLFSKPISDEAGDRFTICYKIREVYRPELDRNAVDIVASARFNHEIDFEVIVHNCIDIEHMEEFMNNVWENYYCGWGNYDIKF